MKGVLVALGLAAMAVPTLAQSSDDRFQPTKRAATARTARTSHAPKGEAAPSPVSSALQWIAAKANAAGTALTSQPAQDTARHGRHRITARTEPAPAEAAPQQATLREPVQPATERRGRRHRVTARIEAVPAETTSQDIALREPAPSRSIAPVETRAFATRTVEPEPVEESPRDASARHSRGYHSCTTGERIISAFYWEGSHTASGARFDPDAMTAAHRTLPFGTRLMVLNPRNGKFVTVTINDRGPFTKGVSLDLSRGAARAIGLQGTGAVCMAKL
jgi:rare lipoprotein A (peptidoglycan hydrolase)